MALPLVRRVPVGDVTLACREYGTGEPLVLINGLASAMDTWNPPVLDALSRHFRVIVFDTRGTGCSGSPGEPFSISLFAEDTARLMEGLGIAGAHVLGFSMGACIAQELVLAFPKKVNRLVLVAGDCGGREAVRSSPDVFSRLIDKSGTLAEVAGRMFPLLFPAAWLATHNPLRYCPEVEETTEDAAAARQLDAFLSWPGSFSRIRAVLAQTLVIAGDADSVVPCENSRTLAGQIPGAELEIFPGAGHGLMYQCPDRFAATVLRFLCREECAGAKIPVH